VFLDVAFLFSVAKFGTVRVLKRPKETDLKEKRAQSKEVYAT
jgi:hypothetical protein